MNIRKFISDKQSLINEGKRLVSMSDDAKFLRKVTIVNLMLNGASASSLSPSCGETTRTLISWMKSVDEKPSGPKNSQADLRGSLRTKKKKLKTLYFRLLKIPDIRYGMGLPCLIIYKKLTESTLEYGNASACSTNLAFHRSARKLFLRKAKKMTRAVMHLKKTR